MDGMTWMEREGGEEIIDQKYTERKREEKCCSVFLLSTWVNWTLSLCLFDRTESTNGTYKNS